MNRFHDWYCASKHWRKIAAARVAWTLEGIDLGEDVLELGPGPGLTSDVLLREYLRLTVLELDLEQARRLQERLPEPRCLVHVGDATRLSYADQSFTGVAALTMLHHVPTAALQDRLFREAFRVLKPGGIFAASDLKSSFVVRLIHLFDTLNPIAPSGLTRRLEAAGFGAIAITETEGHFRFQARRARHALDQR